MKKESFLRIESNSREMKLNFALALIACFALTACAQTPEQPASATSASVEATASVNEESTALVLEPLINEQGTTVESRFNPPHGFERKPLPEHSFAAYLRNLPLKPHGAKVKHYNGEVKRNNVYDAVVDMEISNRDLQQCADAILRLQGEYLYAMQAYDQISFKLTNGFAMDYTEWMQGNRVVVNGNTTTWRMKEAPSNTYTDFRDYMEFVFMYAGTLSLSKSLKSKSIADIAGGDVFIVGGSPGHAVVVVDVAENDRGEKVFLLAQSYMPAQETHILKNMNDTIGSWYRATSDRLHTPEWTFEYTQLKTW
jgi:hypothetical protein